VTFANLPVGWVLAGLATLAGVLFVLQRLRVRHRERTVVTTLFWQEAVQEARARVLTDRFRHPLAYLLILLAAAMLWMSAAGPRLDSGDDSDHVILLDGSAGMAWGDRFAAAGERVMEAVEATPRDRTTVVLCGAVPRTLLLPGENELLLEERLAGVSPQACPETVSRTVRDIAHGRPAERSVIVQIVGDARPGSAPLPDHVRVVLENTPERNGANAGVVALGVTDAASGAWTAVDVLVRVDGTDASPSVSVDGTAIEGETRVGGVMLFRDVPANGGTLTAQVAEGGAVAFDDAASVTLPLRREITVAVPRDAPDALQSALRLDPAVRVVAEGGDADVVVTRSTAGDLPALVLAGENAQDHAFLVVGGDPDVAAAFADLALAQVDATALATAARRVVSLGVEEGEVPQIRVWETLLTERYDFPGQRAFPAFVAGAVRRLAGVRETVPVAAAGEPLPAWTAPITDPAGALLDPADGALVPVEAGRHATAEGRPIEVALLGGVVPPRLADEDRPDVPVVPSRDLTLWAGLLALGLLCAEWLLFRTGRIP
jgi:hypothetical protein